METCRTCKHPVSINAKTCPNCGEKKPVESENVRTIAAVLVLGIFSFLLYSVRAKDEKLFTDQPDQNPVISIQKPSLPITEKPEATTMHKASATEETPEPSLNISLKIWIASMNKELAKSKLKPLKANNDNHECDEKTCTDLYESGPRIGFLVKHHENNIISIIGLASGDGSVKSGVDILLANLTLASVLSPNTQKTIRAPAINKLISSAIESEKSDPVVFDGVKYSAVLVKGMGLMFSATKAD